MSKILLLTFTLQFFPSIAVSQSQFKSNLSKEKIYLNSNYSNMTKYASEAALGLAFQLLIYSALKPTEWLSREYSVIALMSSFGPIVLGERVYEDDGSILGSIVGSYAGLWIGVFSASRINPVNTVLSSSRKQVISSGKRFFMYVLMFLPPPILATVGYNYTMNKGLSNSLVTYSNNQMRVGFPTISLNYDEFGNGDFVQTIHLITVKF